MARFFKVLHFGAGRWPKDAVVSEDEIRNDKEYKFDLDSWVKIKAVVEVDPPENAEASPAGQNQRSPQRKQPPANAQGESSPVVEKRQ